MAQHTKNNTFTPLHPGSAIDIIAPGSSKSKSALPHVIDLLKSWEIHPLVDHDLFGDDLLYAHNNQRRFEIVRDAFYNPNSSVVWALSGGYGSTRLIPKLAALTPPLKAKTLIGFSDITALHIFVTERWGWTTLHAPVLAQIAQKTIDDESIDHIRSILFGQMTHIRHTGLRPLNEAARNIESIDAHVTGGNISMIQSGIGTCWQLSTEGRIIFFEDVDEYAYRTAERLEHLRQSGLFDRPAALIFSNFSWNSEVKESPLMTQQVLEQFADECSFPVFRHEGIGHGCRNLTIPMNAPGRIHCLTHEICLEVDFP